MPRICVISYARTRTAMAILNSTFEKTYVRDFNPHAPSNRHTNPQSAYRKHEQIKKRAYEQRIRGFEHATFSPLVLSASGGLAREATTFYKEKGSVNGKLCIRAWDSHVASGV